MVKVIKTLMGLRGIRNAEISRATGISMTVLSRYLGGHTEIRTESLHKILAVVGVDIDALAKKEVSKALGGFDDGSIGADIGLLLDSMNPIARRTIVDTIVKYGSACRGPEIESALIRTKRFRDSINTVRRISC